MKRCPMCGEEEKYLTSDVYDLNGDSVLCNGCGFSFGPEAPSEKLCCDKELLLSFSGETNSFEISEDEAEAMINDLLR